jgi:transglutaminase-like putative cysteine protease
MRSRFERTRETALFLLRTLLLYLLVVNAWLQLKDQLDLLFLSSAFLIGVLSGLWMEKTRLRILPALLIAAAIPVVLRALFFLVFRLQRAAASAPATDFLFFYFDKDFFPALAAYAVAWLFSFLALRHRAFLLVEISLNALLLLAVFWSQAGYRLTVYPHPSIFAWVLAVFVVGEMFVLLLARPRFARAPEGEGPGRADARAALGFAWILVPLLLVFLLFLLGKYSEGAVKAGGGLMKPTLFRFDFAPYVRLESEIRTSEETVLLFRTPGRAERYLLRRYILSGYEPRRGFFVQRGKGIDEPSTVVPDYPEYLDEDSQRYRNRAIVDQEYFLITIDPSSLIAINYPMRVAPMKNWKSSSFLRVYRVTSAAIRSSEGPEQVQTAPSLPKDILRFYTEYGRDEKIRDLAAEITDGADGYYEKVMSIEQYLRDNFFYSLKPGIAADGNQLHHFLFGSKKGYCSYFAFAMALMCRSLGIPARVAVGFYVDPKAEVLNFYEVRAYQAHAWVEVFFGESGWVEFDPTSDRPAPGEELTPFPGPDRERLEKLIREILQNQTNLEEQLEEGESAFPPASRIVEEIARAALLIARMWYLTLPVLYALFLVSTKFLPPAFGLLSRGGRRRTRALYRMCVVALAGVGLSRRSSESRLEYAHRIESDRKIALTAMTEALLRAAFAERFDADHLQEARAARASFLSSYHRAVPWALRALAVLNPVALPSRRA